MIEIWYLNTKNINKEYLAVFLKFLSLEMINDVLRFRIHEDRRLKVFGKLIVRKYYIEAGLDFSWNNWVVNSDGKPSYKAYKKFNISHSGEYVVVAFSNQEIGVDIEEVSDFDLASVSNCFHPEEIKYLKSTSNQKDFFFRLWTRKEAYLKAIGKGIINGLHSENCLPDKIKDKGTWFLHSLSLVPGYKVALCTQISDSRISARELFPIEFQN